MAARDRLPICQSDHRNLWTSEDRARDDRVIDLAMAAERVCCCDANQHAVLQKQKGSQSSRCIRMEL
jgi:hypothetical protein